MLKTTLFKLILRFWPQILLILITIILSVINFKSGTWLSGWDNLHPEYNFSLNISRSLSSVWQEYQGLGLLAGMAHAADLPRQTFLYFSSLLIPANQLRYVWTFLMLTLGSLGVYQLLTILLIKKKEEILNIDHNIIVKWAGFLGALLYIFNLATVQFFYLPFETFTACYGFMPWLLFLIIAYINESSKKNLFKFFIVSVLTTSAWYVPTIFVVYLMAVSLLFFGLWLHNRNRDVIKRLFTIIGLVITANAFWLLPYTYFTLTSTSVVGNAYQNIMGTEDIFLRNKEFGDLGSVALLKNFWFKFVDSDLRGNLGYMTQPWRDHFSHPLIIFVAYLLFGIILLGLVSAFKKRNSYKWALLFIFLFPVMMLANNTPVFSQIVSFLQWLLPLFKQVFRVPFTKFGLLAALSYSLLFGFGILQLMQFVHKKFGNKFIYGLGILISYLIILTCAPVLQGKLIYERMQLATPAEYFKLFEYFKKQDPNTRIANLPQFDYWGWNHYQWGYVGSGFLWYGIKQPILDRAFDGFSLANENYYWQLSQAIYSKDTKMLESVLNKYQVTWLILDENIVSGFDYKVMNIESLKEMLGRSSKIKLQERFGKILVFKFGLAHSTKSFVSLLENMPRIGPEYVWTGEDVGYSTYGPYLSVKNNYDVYYPFRSLFTGRIETEREFQIEETPSQFIIKNKINIPNFDNYQLYIPSQVSQINQSFFAQELVPQINRQGDNIAAIFTKYNLENSFVGKEYLNKIISNPQSCNPFNVGEIERTRVDEKGFKLVRFSSKASNNCFSIEMPNFSQKVAYVIKIVNRHLTGKGMFFYVVSNTNQKRVLETYLPKGEQLNTSYYLLPALAEDGLGYTLYFDNISIGDVKTINDIGDIEAYPIAYDQLINTTLTKGLDGPQARDISDSSFEVIKKSTWLYRISTNNQLLTTNNSVLQLSQAYHPGWIGFKLKGQNSKVKTLGTIIPQIELLPHVKINNWANGWEIDTPQARFAASPSQEGIATIYLVFWPQLLEFVGFGMLGFGLIYLRKFKVNSQV